LEKKRFCFIIRFWSTGFEFDPDIYIDKKCVIASGGIFDGQLGKISRYDAKDGQFQVKTADGREHWFFPKGVQILNE
jgi:hypothetical protein